MANNRTQSVLPTRGTNNFWWHRLCPDEHSAYVMNEDKHNKIYVPYSVLDEDAVSDHLWIKKASICILGPKIPNLGGVTLVIEKAYVPDVWYPLLICDDGQYSATFEWPDGYEVKMTNDLRFCINTQYLNYPGGSSWTFGPGWIKRSVEIDVLYHVGD